MTIFEDTAFVSRPKTLEHFAGAALGMLPDRGRVLDLGCGSGELVKQICGRAPELDVVGIDISPGNVERASAAVPGATFIAGDFMTVDAGQFDLIVCHSVLQLIPNADQEVAGRLAAMLRPGGVIVATLPIQCAANAAISLQRRAWRMLPGWIDRAALSVAGVAYRSFDRETLQHRIVYLRTPPQRLLDGAFLGAMRSAGLPLRSLAALPYQSFLKLRDAVCVWDRAP